MCSAMLSRPPVDSPPVSYLPTQRTGASANASLSPPPSGIIQKRIKLCQSFLSMVPLSGASANGNSRTADLGKLVCPAGSVWCQPARAVGQCGGFILQERGFKASRRNVNFQAQGIPMMESFCMGQVNYLNQRMRYSWMCCDPQASMGYRGIVRCAMLQVGPASRAAHRIPNDEHSPTFLGGVLKCGVGSNQESD